MIAPQLIQKTAVPALELVAGGTTLMLLRVGSDGLWRPVGYHWAWNVVQTALMGAADAAPSVRPLHVHGPKRWMGRPGHPEPGLLSTLIHLVFALLVWVGMRQGRAQPGGGG